MLVVVVGAASVFVWRIGSPLEIMGKATSVAPELGQVINQPISSYLGYFIIWATAIPVIPHIIMRVNTAKNAASARLSLNLAMLFYSVIILVAVLIIVPVGRTDFPSLEDADQLFLRVIESRFSPLVRGIAVTAVLAAVMSTTDALLLACSSAIAHDILGGLMRKPASERKLARVRVVSTWVIGIIALLWAFSPPELITQFYTAGVGLLSASLFVPTIGGLWWKRANRTGGIAAVIAGAFLYAFAMSGVVDMGVAPIIIALPGSAIAMILGGLYGAPEKPSMIAEIGKLHEK
jgi:sodium/pantothenate symporter